MKHVFIALCLIFCAQVAIGSDLTTAPSILYPYKSRVILQEEFTSGRTVSGTIGSLGWGFSNGTATQLASEVNRIGILRRDTSAVSGTVTSLRLNINSSATFAANLVHDILWMVRLNTNDANTTVRVGIASPTFTTSPPTYGIYFEKLDADTNWFCITNDAGETRTDSGVAVSTNFVTLAHQNIGGTVYFEINNTRVCTHTTEIPTGQASPWTHIVNSAAAAKTLDHDYMQFRVYQLAR